MIENKQDIQKIRALDGAEPHRFDGSGATAAAPAARRGLEALTHMLAHSTAEWLALYTRARCERVVFDQLRGRDLPALLPEYAAGAGSSRLLFPGYVFVWVAPWQRRLAVQTPYVVHLVSFAGEPAVIPEEQLRPYLLAAGQGVRLQPWPYLKQGTRVRVVRGPLRGVEGILDRRHAHRLVLNVDLLTGAAAVEIDAGSVEPVPVPRRRAAAGQPAD